MGHDPQPGESKSDRLDSWKEIASYLRRDARTVRRWEHERHLPVHRVPGGERSGVFAYVAELERWLHTSSVVSDAPSGAGLDASPSRSEAASARQTASDEDLGAEESCGHSAASQSAFHHLNAFETTFVAGMDEGFEPRSTIGGVDAVLLPPTASLPRHYGALALLALLATVACLSAAVVHYREHRPARAIAQQPNSEAQELYLRGRYYWNLRTEDGLNRAVDLFTQAIVNDPHYAAAYAGLADAYLLLRQYARMPDSEAYPRALSAARQAVALDDTSPEAHRSLAFILRFWDWDMTAAEKEYRRAIDLNPNDSQSHHWYATALLSSGRTHEALAQIDMARSLEPQSISVLADRGLILSAIDTRAGIAALQQVEQAEPSFISTHRYLSADFLELRDYESFLSESQTAAELSHDTGALVILGRAQKTLVAEGARPMLREMAADWAPIADRGEFPAYNAARLYSLSGQPDQAMRYLRLAWDRRDPGVLNVENDSAFIPLHSTAEYRTLVSRRGYGNGGNKQPIAKLESPELSE